MPKPAFVALQDRFCSRSTTISSFIGESQPVTATEEQSETETPKLHRMLTLDVAAIQHIQDDVALVASTVDRVDGILSSISTVGRQMMTEWKNATRILELKMGLIGSLYEKYACEDPPQVDMLSVVVTGITAPALAQYFAQDIQELSVHRMQKALFSGCDSLRALADEKMKLHLVEIFYGDTPTKKNEQIAFIMDRVEGQVHQALR
eukprot:jgi/Phyca11/18092/fgenesh1_pg.PHYCAscaffold_33_\